MLGTMTVAALTLSAITAPPPTLTVEIASVNGSGCPAKTVAVAAAKDNSAFTVAYSNFLARAGGDAKPTEFRKNCQLNLRLSYPADFTYAIRQVDHTGAALLQAGAQGVLRESSYYAGGPTTVSRTYSFNGPMKDDWRGTEAVEGPGLFFPPCGQRWNLNLNADLRVTKGASAELSSMSLSPSGGGAGATYHLVWKKCS